MHLKSSLRPRVRQRCVCLSAKSWSVTDICLFLSLKARCISNAWAGSCVPDRQSCLIFPYQSQAHCPNCDMPQQVKFVSLHLTNFMRSQWAPAVPAILKYERKQHLHALNTCIQCLTCFQHIPNKGYTLLSCCFFAFCPPSSGINLTMRWSLTDGKTWEDKSLQIWAGPSGYSTMTSLSGDSAEDEKYLFVIYEKGHKNCYETISFVRIHLYGGR